jgi:hypothetical protein
VPQIQRLTLNSSFCRLVELLGFFVNYGELAVDIFFCLSDFIFFHLHRAAIENRPCFRSGIHGAPFFPIVSAASSHSGDSHCIAGNLSASLWRFIPKPSKRPVTFPSATLFRV